MDAAPDNGTVTALIQMQALKDAYLLVVRQVDPQVFGYYHRTKLAVSEYNRLDQNRSELQLVFAALYAVVSLVMLLARGLARHLGRQPAGAADLQSDRARPNASRKAISPRK